MKIRLIKGDPESEALKLAIDRVLKVERSIASDYRPLKDKQVVRYVIAKHHFTERHLEKYEKDPKSYSFLKPFTQAGARKYLASVDDRDTLANQEGELFYVQVPNNPKEVVKQAFLDHKKNLEHRKTLTKEDSMSEHTNKQLSATEKENEMLKDQIETMQSQITFLHDIVRRLQEDTLERQSVRSGRSRSRFRGGSQHSRGRRTISGRSGRSGVPHEIELGDEGSNLDNDWSEHYDDETMATFRSAQRRNSMSSAVSAVSGVSRSTTISRASKSIKSLPREKELEQDEEDSDSHSSHDGEDGKSVVSNWQTQNSRLSDDSDTADYGYGNTDDGARSAMDGGRPSIGPGMPPRRISNPPSKSLEDHIPDHSPPGTGDSENTSVAGTYQVQALVVTDPYGEQGTYTGSISNSTNMPHGYGRLEYDRAGRWYEGKWIQQITRHPVFEFCNADMTTCFT